MEIVMMKCPYCGAIPEFHTSSDGCGAIGVYTLAHTCNSLKPNKTYTDDDAWEENTFCETEETVPGDDVAYAKDCLRKAWNRWVCAQK